MTEIDRSTQANGAAPIEDDSSYPSQAAADDTQGNAAGDRWDTNAGTTAAAGTTAVEDGYEMVPRPNDEVDNPTAGAPATAAASITDKQSWADEVAAPPAYETGAAGNNAGESWDTKAAGEQAEQGWAPDTTYVPNTVDNSGWGDATAAGEAGAATPRTDADGFHEVAGRHRGGGRGGPRGGRGDGESRGRGRGRGGFRGGRGDGEFRGRGRGRGGDGEFRGRGRGRGGPRGDVPAARS